ncbi:hypothetical protein AKUH3B110M_02920 [Apilactobacillus kunkeei]|nr:hypothetical protein AKUG0802_02910 [Apilactobacillus kunkeei]CAI2567348.1 hypothetical protein AKUG0804_02930 [Apilactobacillus kunkeei]CAI2567468.1 hypothetical protein AKUG0103_02920 [Apilactobacillus kunkeei]CAI2567471.1 hypothetical protein AKUG0101_02960 [Apilactobacillus kunkeei]CAI2567492.1 hypothetical protein AKUG0405_02920 [Apilactobacillus kunkeei]
MDKNENAQKVVVNLKTTIFQDEEREDFIFEEVGSLVQMNNGLYLRFTEHQDNQAVANVTLKITDEHVQLTRQTNGGHHSRMIFDENKDHDTIYQTEYGPIKILVKTKELNYDYNEDIMNGKVGIDYELHSGGMIVGEYNLTLQFSA